MPNEVLCILGFIYDRKSSFRPHLACLLSVLLAVTFLLKADAHAYWSSAGQQSADMRPLVLGIPIERALTSGESHSFQIALEPDQYLQVAVTHSCANVTLPLLERTGCEAR